MFNQNAYSSSSSPYAAPAEPLAFYSAGSGGSSGGSGGNYYQSGDSAYGYGGNMMGGMGNMGSMGSMQGGERVSGMMAAEGRWWEAFGTGGLEGEPGLMEDLGISPSHILQKSLTVLNPFGRIDQSVMDDADLAGPFVVWCAFAFVLLLSGKPTFSHIYGLGILGTAAIYVLLNLMSETGIDAYRCASVLGYCLIPMVGLGSIGIGVGIQNIAGYLLSILSILWCTYSASAIFVAVLRMSHQRLLVAYPVGLLYGCFALLSIFRAAN